MVAGQFVPKQQLFGQIRTIVSTRDTGFLTILTDTKRSVLLRFSAGRLTHSHCRSKDVAEAIQVLTECDSVKFTYASAQVENRPEIMAAETFLQLIDPGGDGGMGGSPAVAPMPPPVAAQPATEFYEDLLPQVAESMRSNEVNQGGGALSAELKHSLVQLALEYVGPMASMIVDDAFESAQTASQAIDQITSMIPDAVQSAAFREAARSRFL